MPLTADENAALIQRLGWTDPPAQAPPPPMAPPPAPMQAAPSPLDQALVDANGGARRPAPPIVTPNRPGAPANAHVAGDYSRTALAPEQTTAYTGPRPGAPAQESPGFTFPESPGGGGTTSGGSSRTVQKGVQASDETKALLNASTATGLEANAQEQAGQHQLSAARSEGAKQQAALYGEQAHAEQVLASESDEQLGRKRAHLEQMVADVQNEKVDPDHFWHSRSTGQKIAIGLSMIAGGFAGGWSGTGKNNAADMLDRSIQNDIHAQEENLANKRAGVQQQSQLYEMARGEFHDRQERMRAMHVTALAQVGKQIDARIAEASDPIEIARLKEARAGIFAKAGESRLRLDEMGADKVSVSTHSTFTAAPKGGPSRKEFDALTEKLVLEKNLSVNDAHTLAAKMLQLPGAPQGDGAAPSGDKGAKETVMLDGKPAQAINEQAAKDWHDYQRISPEAHRLYGVLQSALKNGDPAAYDAAKGKLIEVLPALYGYARGPSVSQVEHTFGPDVIPDYPHWYSPTLSSRVDTKIDDLGKTLSTLDSSMRTDTFGEAPKAKDGAEYSYLKPSGGAR